MPEEKRAWHAGKSHWREIEDVNSASIGIEIVNPGHDHGYRPFPDGQIDAVIRLVHQIKDRYEITRGNIVAHSDIAPARKRDPGAQWQPGRYDCAQCRRSVRGETHLRHLEKEDLSLCTDCYTVGAEPQGVKWTPEADKTWEESKRLVSQAVALSVPDWEGAADGSNPFVYYADRAGYGVGGGLFQRPGKGMKVPDAWKGQLRPPAMWSKSLDKTQRNWATWEGELF